VAELGYETDESLLAAALAALGPEERVLVAESGGEIHGFASGAIVPFFHDRSRRLRLTAVAVTPSQRGRGIARSLIGALETWGRERGCNLVEVSSAERRVDAHAAYRALGFEEAPRRFTRRL
jgi:GNAT superfamily N-acetyltransferase